MLEQPAVPHRNRRAAIGVRGDLQQEQGLAPTAVRDGDLLVLTVFSHRLQKRRDLGGDRHLERRCANVFEVAGRMHEGHVDRGLGAGRAGPATW